MTEVEAMAQLLAKIELFVAPLPAKIGFSLHIGTAPQMRADLEYMKRLFRDMAKGIDEQLAADLDDADGYTGETGLNVAAFIDSTKT
jgi:hypothetical protein